LINPKCPLSPRKLPLVSSKHPLNEKKNSFELNLRIDPDFRALEYTNEIFFPISELLLLVKLSLVYEFELLLNFEAEVFMMPFNGLELKSNQIIILHNVLVMFVFTGFVQKSQLLRQKLLSVTRGWYHNMAASDH